MQRKSVIDIQVDPLAITTSDTAQQPVEQVSLPSSGDATAAPTSAPPPVAPKPKKKRDNSEATPAAAVSVLAPQAEKEERSTEEVELTNTSSDPVQTLPAVDEKGVPKKSCCSIL